MIFWYKIQFKPKVQPTATAVWNQVIRLLNSHFYIISTATKSYVLIIIHNYELLLDKLVKELPALIHEVSISRSQNPVTERHPEAEESSPHLLSHTQSFSTVHFNIILPPTPWSFRCPLSLRFPDQNEVCVSHFHPCVLHVQPISSLSRSH
jgi:hypothetical protein